MARQWLARQGLKAIVRAHMVQAAGYEVLGDSQVITVFSAANYRNSGACAVLCVLGMPACLGGYQQDVWQPARPPVQVLRSS